MNEWSEYTKLLIALLAICNPISAVPLFIGFTSGLQAKERRSVALTAALATTIALLTMSLIGTSILGLFGISLDAFRIAGGILLLIMSMSMMGVTTGGGGLDRTSDPRNMGVVPLAIPLMAGPGSISTVIVYVGNNPVLEHRLIIVSVIVTIGVLVYIVLRGSLLSARFLSPVTLSVFNRVMGLIIAALSVEFIIDGISAHFPALAAS